MKTNFGTCTYMQAEAFLDGRKVEANKSEKSENTVSIEFEQLLQKNQKISLIKYGGYTVSTNHPKEDLINAANTVLDKASKLGFEYMLNDQKESWNSIWEMSDITIEGDVKVVVPTGIPKLIVSHFIWQQKTKL